MFKNKKTRNISLLVALVLVTSLFVGTSIARYVTSSSSEDEARVAIWGIEGDTVTMELFDSKYDANGNRIAESNDGDKIITPGTSMSSAFSIMDINSTIAPEVMYEVGINLDDSEIAPEILANPSVQWKLDNNPWGTWEECKEDILNLTGSTGGKKIYAPNTLPDSFADGQEHTIAWQWLMDNGTDEEDTAMGNAAVSGDLTAKIKVGVTAKQVDVDSTGMIEGQDSVYDPSNPEPLVFKSIAPLSELQSVKVGTTTLTEGEHYTKADGSTIITLKTSYLDTLEKGKYIISIISDNMTAKASFQVKKTTNNLVHNNIIPEGGIYYVGVTANLPNENGEYEEYTKKYTSGEKFPEISDGDIYIYEDYEYRYNREHYGLEYSWINATFDGWGVDFIGNTSTPTDILETINGKDIKSLYSLFYNSNAAVAPKIPNTVTNIEEAFCYCTFEVGPIIPASVTNMSGAFIDCPNLTTIEVNANPTYYSGAFSGASKLTTITGTCLPETKQLLLNTK